MTDDEKKELARLLVPHLAWDLARAEFYSFKPSDTASGAQAAMLIEQVTMKMRALALEGKGFSVAIIPVE